MSKQTFVANTVLTAAQMNTLQTNDYNQTVSTKTASYTLVATDAGTTVVMNAAGATTITVNTSLFSAGDTLKLGNIGAGVCTVTAGTATVSSAGPLAIPQYGTGTLYFTSAGVSIYSPTAVTAAAASSGLTLISAGTKSAATTQSFNGVFSTDYRNYKVILSQITTSSDNQEIYLRVGTSGTPDTGNNYKFNRINVSGGGTVSGSGATTLTNMMLMPQSGVANNFVELTFNSPFETERTIINAQSLGNRATFIPEIFYSLLIVDTATSYTDISVTTSSGANFTCNFGIYGFEQ